MMTPQMIHDRLIHLFPDYATVWSDPSNCHRDDDGSFTRCGAFAAFSSYFQEHYERLPQDRVAALGQFITDCVASADAELADTAATWFLENVAAERFSDDFKKYLNNEALRFYSLWDG
jgi:hypothetical protein